MFCTAKGKSPPKPPPLLNGTINRPNLFLSTRRRERESLYEASAISRESSKAMHAIKFYSSVLAVARGD
jgi:hypothetical protein